MDGHDFIRKTDRALYEAKESSIVDSFGAFAAGFYIGIFFALVYNFLVHYFVNEPKE